jgi:hypothetical protein
MREKWFIRRIININNIKKTEKKKEKEKIKKIKYNFIKISAWRQCCGAFFSVWGSGVGYLFRNQL